jgi:hypothetical protein
MNLEQRSEEGETSLLPVVKPLLCFWKEIANKYDNTRRSLDICRTRCEGYGKPISIHIGETDCKIYHLWRERK